MYGTLEPKNGLQDSVGADGSNKNVLNDQYGGSKFNSRQSLNPTNSGNKWIFPTGSNNDQLNRKKKIYTHCHVQKTTHDAPVVDKSARRRLIAASIICLVFMIGEVVGGVLSNSLAIATDAAHLLTDFASFMISLFAIWLSSRPASKKMSFGWYRAEVIGALLSVLMIWLVTGLLVYLAIERLRTGQFEINSLVMVITASAGLLVNIIMAVALNVDGHFHSHGHGGHNHGHSHHNHNHNHHHHNHNHDDGCEHQHIGIAIADTPASKTISSTLGNNSQKIPELNTTRSESPDLNRGRGRSNINVRAAFIHVIGDFLQSLGVLIAALVIHFEPSYTIVDPICTFLFSIIVLITTINIIRDATNVLMEGIPDGINFLEVREHLQGLAGVIRVHNLRIWSLSLDKMAISTHLVIDDSRTPSQLLKEASDLLKTSYNFFEVTIQIEEYKDDMRDCEHCQDDDVITNVVQDTSQKQSTSPPA